LFIYTVWGGSPDLTNQAFALGGSGTLFDGMEWLAERIAKVGALPQVIETPAVAILPYEKEIYCSSWASKIDFLSAIYNHEIKPMDITLQYSKSIFKQYNYLLTDNIMVTRIGSEGKPLKW